MASLSVRKLDDAVVSKLRVRAAQHGLSMEEEVRRILTWAVSTPDRLGDLALELFGFNLEVGLELEPGKRIPHEQIKL